MTGFSDDQLSALRAPLARDHVKTRQQAGRTLSYVEGWVVVAEANRIFGFDAWDRETIECRCVAENAAKLGPNKDRDGWRVAYVGKVRITVRAGDQLITREGTGYGSGIDADIGEAHESAAKECETDATKRAMMTFGSPMGLALYDKAQAEVEPAVNARRAAPPPNARAPIVATPAADEREEQLAKAIAIKDELRAAIEAAALPADIDRIIKVSGPKLEFIKQYSSATYDRLMGLAASRGNELRSAA